MYVANLALTDFRSYRQLAIEFGPGVIVLSGPNGQGKTNIIEAIGYVSSLTSHRSTADAPLIHSQAERAIVQTTVVRAERRIRLALEISAGRAAAPSINGVLQRRRRDVMGILRTVVFAPEDLGIVKGDPEIRRRFLDTLLIQLNPRMAGEIADYERVARQRSSLLKSLGGLRRAGRRADLHTLEVWDEHLAEYGARLAVARQELVARLQPHAASIYCGLAGSDTPARLHYRHAIDDVDPGATPDSVLQFDGPHVTGQPVVEVKGRLTAAMGVLRDKEIERGVNLVGPHRDDLQLHIGPLPARTHASHGESWSFALALKLAAFAALNEVEGGPAVLVLDDVFAELDQQRRDALCELTAAAEQVIVTAAVPMDLPSRLGGRRYRVEGGQVTYVP
jgi:DNA replication and repair protein RecF